MNQAYLRIRMFLLCIALCGCNKPSQPNASDRHYRDPTLIILEESPAKDEIWLSVRSFFDSTNIGGIVLSQNDLHDTSIRLERLSIERKQKLGEFNIPPMPPYPVRT